jgi:hypothetical protein
MGEETSALFAVMLGWMAHRNKDLALVLIKSTGEAYEMRGDYKGKKFMDKMYKTVKAYPDVGKK